MLLDECISYGENLIKNKIYKLQYVLEVSRPNVMSDLSGV